MRKLYVALAGALLAGPYPGPAQVPPRYYAGLGLYGSTFQPLGYHYGRTTLPVQVLAGYRWRPRWAVQLGAAFSGYSGDYSYGGQWLDPATGNPAGDYSYTGRYTNRQQSLTLLARRTLTRWPAHRCQFDLVGGLTYEHGHYRDAGRYVSTYPGNPLDQPYEAESQLTQLLVGLGPGLRLRAATRLEATFDLLFNAPLGRRSGTGLTSATALGLRYRFGAPR